MVWTLLAQSPVTDIPAISGWGAFGLSGAILFWLLYKHLPDKDKQMKELIDAAAKAQVDLQDRHDKRSADQLAAFNLHAREVREDYKQSLSQVLAHCEVELQGVMAIMHKDMDALRSAIELLAQSERVNSKP